MTTTDTPTPVESTITFTDEDRLRYGGDWSILRTIPKIHPKLGIPLRATRDSIDGASAYYFQFYRGDMINKLNPSGVSPENPKGEYNFCLWTSDGSKESRRFFMTLKHGKGFKPCNSDEWEIGPDLDGIFTKENNMIVIKGGIDGLSSGPAQYDVLMWRTRARMEEEERKMSVMPQNVQQRADSDIADRVSGERHVSVRPTTIEELPHVYTPPPEETN
jgi:hypothetical protein